MIVKAALCNNVCMNFVTFIVCYKLRCICVAFKGFFLSAKLISESIFVLRRLNYNGPHLRPS